jgi:hypothetical protein
MIRSLEAQRGSIRGGTKASAYYDETAVDHPRKAQSDLTATAIFMGTAGITEGVKNNNNAHIHYYTYVIDLSVSTILKNPCGFVTILECEKSAVVSLDDKIADSGVAVDVGLVKFAGSAKTLVLNPDVAGILGQQCEIQSLGFEYGTDFGYPVREAVKLVNASLQNPNTKVTESFVVFLPMDMGLSRGA